MNQKFLNLILLFLLGFNVSCYQVESLPPIEGVSGNLLTCSKANIEGPFETFDSLNLNLEQFYREFVFSPDGSSLPLEIDYQMDLFYDTRVDYKKILAAKETIVLKRLRNSVLGHLMNLDLNALSKAEQIASLINAYNFIAIDIVIQNSCEGLIKSIADLGGKDSFKAFSDASNFGYLLAGEKVSLDQIEKEKLASLTNFEDARIHFAVICASGGCPVLLHKPFVANQLEEQLNFITRAGLRLPRMFKNIDGKSFLSSIFDWYLDDFIADIEREEEFSSDEEYIEAFVKKFTHSETPFFVDAINYIDYDWELNKL